MLCTRPKSARANFGRAKIPEGVRFAAAYVPLCTRPKSARANFGRAKIPEGVRFAAAGGGGLG